MVKELTSEDETEILRMMEGMILDKLLAAYNAGTKSLNYQEITDQISSPHPEDIDTALEDLIAQALIHSPDGENYYITNDGTIEHNKRKTDGTLF
jgi:hypothetical protein